MFNWIQAFIGGKSTEPSRQRPCNSVQIAGLIDGEEHRAQFQEIARLFGWTAFVCGSWDEGISMLDLKRPTILVYDRDLSDGDWRTAMSKLIALYPSIYVLLASTVTDQYLWNEVIRYGGYDVVLKPFRAEEMRRTVNFASTSMEWSVRVHK